MAALVWLSLSSLCCSMNVVASLHPPEAAAGVFPLYVPQLLHHPRAQVLPEPVGEAALQVQDCQGSLQRNMSVCHSLGADCLIFRLTVGQQDILALELFQLNLKILKTPYFYVSLNVYSKHSFLYPIHEKF